MSARLASLVCSAPHRQFASGGCAAPAFDRRPATRGIVRPTPDPVASVAIGPQPPPKPGGTAGPSTGTTAEPGPEVEEPVRTTERFVVVRKREGTPATVAEEEDPRS